MMNMRVVFVISVLLGIVVCHAAEKHENQATGQQNTNIAGNPFKFSGMALLVYLEDSKREEDRALYRELKKQFAKELAEQKKEQ